MSEHTQGPWITSEYGQYLGGKPGRVTVCSIANPASVVAENVKPEDGPLIAAAPELLEACHKLMSLVEQIDRVSPPEDDTWLRSEEYKAAVAVLAKATE